MMSLIAAAREPDYPVEIACVISNRPEAQGCSRRRARASQRAPSTTRVSARAKASRRRSTRPSREFSVDLIACAGFMRVMTPAFVERWRDRMLNIHPSLLPAFTGLNTHERALAAGVKIAGCTVHVVRPEVDTGPIIAQAAVPVLDGDTPETLGARVLEAEHLLYPHALSLFASGAITVSGERTIARQAAVNQAKPLFWPPFD